MAGQVSHARRALRVIHSFEQAREERLSIAGRTSDLGGLPEQSTAGLAEVSPVLEQAAVDNYPATVLDNSVGSNADSKGFAAPTNPVRSSIKTALQPAVIGQSSSNQQLETSNSLIAIHAHPCTISILCS